MSESRNSLHTELARIVIRDTLRSGDLTDLLVALPVLSGDQGPSWLAEIMADYMGASGTYDADVLRLMAKHDARGSEPTSESDAESAAGYSVGQLLTTLISEIEDYFRMTPAEKLAYHQQIGLKDTPMHDQE